MGDSRHRVGKHRIKWPKTPMTPEQERLLRKYDRGDRVRIDPYGEEESPFNAD